MDFCDFPGFWQCCTMQLPGPGEGSSNHLASHPQRRALETAIYHSMWMVVKIVVPIWIPMIVRHLIFRVPKKGP